MGTMVCRYIWLAPFALFVAGSPGWAASGGAIGSCEAPEFMAHCLGERFHQGLGGQLIRKESGSPNDSGVNGKVVRRSRLGGMLNYYQREAA